MNQNSQSAAKVTHIQDKLEPILSDLQTINTLKYTLDQQKQSFLTDETESLDSRRKHLENLKKMLIENQDEIIQAIHQDYGNRSYHETLFAEFVTVSQDISNNLKHLKHWMKPQKRAINHLMFPGAKNQVIAQPLGVVGLIIPWNFPLNLTFIGLSAVFAAGNRAMVKLSENSSHFSELMIKIAPKYFNENKLKFFKETGQVGIAFSQLPFDHLIFTGSGETGKKVMAAAAKNLTPVTLELGGKSPAIIAPDYPMPKAVSRLMFVKQFNAGQICTCVDYVFVHQQQIPDFIKQTKLWVKKHCPDIYSMDYTSIIDEKSFQRLELTLEDAQQKGAQVINLHEQAPDIKVKKMPLYLILNATPDMLISNRETFGPLLMVKSYQDPKDVTDYIHAKDKPLALYPFSYDKKLVQHYIDRILSGGVSVNDALLHVAQHDIPFGGVGASGMGHYHGYEGFLTFSKLRPIFYQANFSGLKFLAPPYGKLATKVLNLLMK